MFTITISRTKSARHGAPKDGRSSTRRRIVVGVLAAVIIVGAIVGGIWCAQTAPARNFHDLLLAEDAASGQPKSSDAEILQSMNNTCDSLRGASMNTFLTRDPAYQPKTVTYDEYVEITDEYCASRG